MSEETYAVTYNIAVYLMPGSILKFEHNKRYAVLFISLHTY